MTAAPEAPRSNIKPSNWRDAAVAGANWATAQCPATAWKALHDGVTAARAGSPRLADDRRSRASSTSPRRAAPWLSGSPLVLAWQCRRHFSGFHFSAAGGTAYVLNGVMDPMRTAPTAAKSPLHQGESVHASSPRHDTASSSGRPAAPGVKLTGWRLEIGHVRVNLSSPGYTPDRLRFSLPGRSAFTGGSRHLALSSQSRLERGRAGTWDRKVAMEFMDANQRRTSGCGLLA